MKIETYNNLSLFIQSLIALGAIVFGGWQILINSKLKKIQESVALSIVPGQGLNLHLMNVGAVNLYLSKYEIGQKTENFEKNLLIAAGASSFLQITIPDFNRGKKYPIKLYLIDDFQEKYLSTGEIIIEDVEVMSQVITSPVTDITLTPMISMEPTKIPRIKAWSYKTEKRNWEI